MNRRRPASMESIETIVRVATLVAAASFLTVAVVPVPVRASCAGTLSVTQEPLTAPTAITDAVARAESVFRGRVLRREDTRRTPSFYEEKVTFAVETVWKGPAERELFVLTNECRNPKTLFATDGTYIVYMGRFGNDTGAMNHSKRVTGPAEEDAVLGPGTAPSPPHDAITPASPEHRELPSRPQTAPRQGGEASAPLILLVAGGIACIALMIVRVARQ